MRPTIEKFTIAFKRLKHKIDLIPLTAYQRQEILEEMNEIRMCFERKQDRIMGSDKP